ncbi:hypothetical protein BC938DRAFT_476549 [Jimgerdemannia flammicorona]|uniref:Galactose oxidase n=1 Tax=Jimgerdemannia flammicorona TaxID=994334 RepID=A0A433QQC8_9FUNG|nr:hypothetical protein BC938DRAFT_476549 [Jimgerdemannia flammicorona]
MFTANTITSLGTAAQSAVLIESTIYVYGGEGDNGPISNLYTLDVSLPWETSSPPWYDRTSDAGTFTVPQVKSHAMWPSLDSNFFYIWGGSNEGEDSTKQAQNGFAQYNVVTRNWSLPSAIANMPQQRSDLTVAWNSSGFAHIWGGWSTILSGSRFMNF